MLGGGYRARWATELGMLHLKGQHIAGHFPFIWYKKMNAGLLPPLLPLCCTLR